MNDSNRTSDGRFKVGHKVRKPTSMKRVSKIAEAEELGKQRAQLKAHQKKPLIEKIDEHIGHIIDNTKITDVAEVGAALGLSFVVHDAIMSTKELLDKVIRTANGPMTLIAAANTGGIFGVTNVYLQAIHDWLPFLGNYLPISIPAPSGSGTAPKSEISGMADIIIWVISFGIAYMLIHNSYQLTGLVDKGIVSVIGMLLP